MNLFIVTSNYYLFCGIESLLVDKVHHRLTLINPEEAEKSSQIKNAGCSDIIFLVSEGTHYAFHFLQQACKSKAKVIYAKHATDFPFNKTFDFIVISARFYLSDILLAINVRQVKSRTVRYPRITETEKLILYYTARGASVNAISQYLSISISTVYQHQRNALSKVGVRKASQLPELPKNFIEYLYLRY
ncbi:helix-turn-helix transcriptional regulator [Enterobacter asburiae]|uniref:helix-turn-helix domain-containing protein n=1 Tax=Enterobacter asburiae TaxID=61645 RepID=UPI0020040B5A|nr:helix-turn-helix transcriptional regulator [Enterobacter asburiae]MCK7230005.1 helix-turn-helix transcriptional regulator [Enterobacter asburiae]